MIEIESLSYRYEDTTEDILKGIDLCIAEGSYLALIGRNGCGKTTLVKHLNALLLPSSGRVTIDGMDSAVAPLWGEIRTRVGMVFQNPDHQIIGMTVEEDVAFGPENLGLSFPEITKRVAHALETLGLEGFEKRFPQSLSGGEKRLLSLAGVLAMEPRYIVFDEPAAYLDPAARSLIIGTIKKLHAAGTTIIHVTHDPRDILAAQQVALMDRGGVALFGAVAEVLGRDDTFRILGMDAAEARALRGQMAAQTDSAVTDGGERG
ncbi:MAG: ATP-binding cassette domain-containing protein [Smithellaceae bacterium]|nr:ATP-binding cassette domain-containing protein [Smithellaceae bacterium]